jgi:hypothetical protein
MTKLTDEIRGLAHWEIAVRPESFDATRLARADLVATVHQATVQMRGWPVPYIGNGQLLRGATWVGQDIEPLRVPQMEAWRMFTSGQFTQLRVISAELEHSTRGQAVIEVWEVLFYLTEVFEFASRLALTKAGAPSMTVDVRLKGAAGRTLTPGEAGRILWQDYQVTSDDIHYSVTLDRDRVVAAAREEAVAAAVDVFWNFGWDITEPRTLRDYQSQLLARD